MTYSDLKHLFRGQMKADQMEETSIFNLALQAVFYLKKESRVKSLDQIKYIFHKAVFST